MKREASRAIRDDCRTPGGYSPQCLNTWKYPPSIVNTPLHSIVKAAHIKPDQAVKYFHQFLI